MFNFYNFRTEQYDCLETPPEDWRDYIPQHETEQSLYELYKKTGLSPVAAAAKVLELCSGVNNGK